MYMYFSRYSYTYMTHTSLQIYKTIANTRIINVYAYRCYGTCTCIIVSGSDLTLCSQWNGLIYLFICIYRAVRTTRHGPRNAVRDLTASHRQAA